MINLSDIKVLEQYLQEKGLVTEQDGHSVHYCNGGVSCTVVFVDRPNQKPLIIKQALEQLKVAETWLCDPNRMRTEYDSNAIYHELMPENAPEVYFYDDDNYIYGREAVPDNCNMWKDDLMTGLLDFEVARKAVETMVVVHNHSSRNADIKERFKDKDIFYSLRISPYIEFTVGKYPELKEKSEVVISEMMDSQIALIHGDYSPKNIMVIGRGISVLDYEVATFGHPAFDLAFFINHFILKSIKFPQQAQAFLNMAKYMVSIYLDKMDYMDKATFENCTVRTLAFLMLARVDGKSPVEYLKDEPEKQDLVRKNVFEILDNNITTFAQAFEVICNNTTK